MPENSQPRPEQPEGPPAKMSRRNLLRTTAWAGGIAATGAIAGVAANRFGARRPAGAKPALGEEFTYDISHLQKTDPALIRCQEVKRFATGMERPRFLAAGPDGTIWVAGEAGIRKFSASGEQAGQFAFKNAVWSLAVRADGTILAGQKDQITVLDASGTEKAVWTGFDKSFLPTGIAEFKDALYVADAKNRKVLKLDGSGKAVGEIGKRDKDSGARGFVVPSPYFCVRVAKDGLIRVSNPGAHLIEAYTPEGTFEVAWGKASFAVEGFCGCCNPVSFDLLPDGSFVTTEKGLPRVKLYNPHGEFSGVVAGPDAFPEYLAAANGGASETATAGIYTAVDPRGRILVLDSVGRDVRIYTLKANA